MSKELKLTVELVPRKAWGQNLRGQITRGEWDKIRKDVIASQEHRCGICRAEGKLICHEVWEYDDVSHIQKLKSLIALCDLCNHVKHLGHASILAGQGKLDMKRVEEHFMRVNECDLETFRKHAREAMAQHKERSKHEWSLDLGNYKKHVKNANHNRGYAGSNDPGPNHGDNMPDTCPNCGAVGTVVFLPDEAIADDESEAWIAEYEAGMIGSGRCTKCKTVFLWQG